MHRRWRCLLCAATIFFSLAPLAIKAQDTSAAVADSSTIGTAASTDSSATTDSTWFTTGPYQPVALRPTQAGKGDVRRFLTDDDFWYVAVGPDKPKPVAEPLKEKLSRWDKFLDSLAALFSIRWVSFLLWSLLVGLMVGAIVLFIQSGSGERWFGHSRRLGLEGDPGTEAAQPDDLHQAFQKAVQKEAYAEAERCLFLLALAALGDRGLIQPGLDKANREYLRELRGGPLYDDFFRLLRHYEYTFYGGFALSQVDFGGIREQYVQFQHRLDTL